MKKNQTNQKRGILSLFFWLPLWLHSLKLSQILGAETEFSGDTNTHSMPI